MNKKAQILNEQQKPKLCISVVMPRFLLRPFYLLLKKDMVKRLSEKHGEQFIDDVMETFCMPTDTTNEYLKSLKQTEKNESIILENKG
jgi:hypothetical protein